MGDIQDKDAALTTKLVGADLDGTEQTPVQSTEEGRLTVSSIDEDKALNVIIPIVESLNLFYDKVCKDILIDSIIYNFYSNDILVDSFMVTGIAPEWCVQRVGLLQLEDGGIILTESGDRLRWI